MSVQLARLTRLSFVRVSPGTSSRSFHALSKRTAGQNTRAIRQNSGRRWATSTTPTSSAVNPAEVEAMQCLEDGTQKLEEGDVQAAKSLYQRSVDIKRTASGLFNLGVTYYHLKEYDQAISCWKDSIVLQPSSPDAHTNLASAYIVSPVSRPDLALHHLRVASSLAPEDGEIAFNLAAVLEACGLLEESLQQYKKSKEFGVERAAMHMRNVSAKILGKKMKAAEAEVAQDKSESTA
ncbi:TPR-like protein [Dichomitus squalens]|uniref:TPR-like protein n=2 Tax=Dichomitus squalens TaxID=114155 RepID=A0A4V2K0N1_9APHY|nr:TPR-like protein [Dichomitus squalens LYAD-421 SS1]EJF56572.1 TPR-like protein [Dichomitus squalens LYAD-421 SS1]TBU29453.1 TPR-like protein [Dichomitus squalens]TBU42217.1 TPR-like protein [Dichomitus squalens]TBU54364.1 TPR-like protein [Dichomitus squalens]